MKIPAQMLGTIEMVDVEWILQNVTHSADGFNDDDGLIDWRAIMHDKCMDESFDLLLNTISRKGFRVPICLYQSDEAFWGLGNGHHRMCAAILFCLDRIPVYWSDDDYMSESSTNLGSLMNTPGAFKNFYEDFELEQSLYPELY